MKSYVVDRGIVYQYDLMFRDYLFYAMVTSLTAKELKELLK